MVHVVGSSSSGRFSYLSVALDSSSLLEIVSALSSVASTTCLSAAEESFASSVDSVIFVASSSTCVLSETSSTSFLSSVFATTSPSLEEPN